MPTGVSKRSHGSPFPTVLCLSLEPYQTRRRSLLLAGAVGAGAPGVASRPGVAARGCFVGWS